MGGIGVGLSRLAGTVFLLTPLSGSSLTPSGAPPLSADPMGTPVKGTAVRGFSLRDLPPPADPGPDAPPARRLTLDKRAFGEQRPGPRAPQAAPAEGPLTPQPVLVDDSFAGLQQLGVEPPDPQLAAGPTKLIEMVNARGQVYDKEGVALGPAFALAGLQASSGYLWLTRGRSGRAPLVATR